MRKVLITVAAVVVLAIGGAALWWYWPTFGVRAALRDVELPDTMRLTDTRMDHNRICFDSCGTNGSRHYLTSVPAEQAAETVRAEMAADGWTVEAKPCERGCSFAPQPFSFLVQKWTWEVDGTKGDLRLSVLVGTRKDGNPGMDLSIYR